MDSLNLNVWQHRRFRGQLKSTHDARTYRRTLGVADWRGGGDLVSARESLHMANLHQICRFCEAPSVLKQSLC
jgi:hypothetical protein